MKCLRCNIPLSDDYQLIFDETGIELQLNKLLAEHFKIFLIKDLKTTQALCNECLNKLIELYDTQKFSEENSELPKENVTETSTVDDDIEEKEPHDIIEKIADESEINSFEETIEEPVEKFPEFKNVQEEPDYTETTVEGQFFQDYLQNVIKSDLEQISFDHDSVCICTEYISNHQDLLTHVEQNHETESMQYPCVFCDKAEINFESTRSLAHHVVLKHYDLNSVIIYCICPECNTRFSSFLEYNKHSCYKQSFASRLQQKCKECCKEFSSNKRYRFHLQFHLKKQRPKACFICDILFSDENDFFEHIMYAHEKEDAFVCKTCDRVCTTQQLYENHLRLHNAIRSFHCPYCTKSYLYNQMLLNHIQQHHSDEQSNNKCKICKKTLATRHLLKRHMQLMHLEETESDVFLCAVCGLVGMSKEDIKYHVEEGKCQEAEVNSECLRIAYACEFCELAFNSVDNLNQHRLIHGDKDFKCWICDSKYSEFKKLKTHILTHNNYEPLQNLFPINRHYVCNINACKQSYLTWPTLRAHKVRHTTQLSCSICSQTFNTEFKLNSHFKSHVNDEEFRCQFCSKVCVSQMSLAVHVARKHNNNCAVCPTCKATCSSKEALQEHIDTRHTEMECEHCGKTTKNKRNMDIHILMVHTKVKNFFCKICNKGYFYNNDLKTHMRAAHAEPNKFKCKDCKFSTSYEASYNVHILKHSKTKPFKCEECSREFTRKSCYRLHLLRHSDNKPFVCTVEDCGRSFVMKGILNSHLKSAHPDYEMKSKSSSVQKKVQLDMEGASSSDCVLTEVLSDSEFLEVYDEEGGIVYDESNAAEEILPECSEEDEEMYID